MKNMNKEQVCQFLQSRQIPYTAIEHPAVYTVQEAEALHLPHPECGAKNLFLRDDKKRFYCLLTARDNLKISLGEFQRKFHSRRLTFASEEDLMHYLGLIKGAVTPLGALNDEERIVHVYIDSWFAGKDISIHPNENTATVYMAADDLLRLLQEHGTSAEYIDLESE